MRAWMLPRPDFMADGDVVSEANAENGLSVKSCAFSSTIAYGGGWGGNGWNRGYGGYGRCKSTENTFLDTIS